MNKLIINCESNETVERELNAEEIAQQAIDEANIAAAKAIADAELATKAAQKAALLERLGISQDEANLLLS